MNSLKGRVYRITNTEYAYALSSAENYNDAKRKLFTTLGLMAVGFLFGFLFIMDNRGADDFSVILHAVRDGTAEETILLDYGFGQRSVAYVLFSGLITGLFMAFAICTWRYVPFPAFGVISLLVKLTLSMAAGIFVGSLLLVYQVGRKP